MPFSRLVVSAYNYKICVMIIYCMSSLSSSIKQSMCVHLHGIYSVPDNTQHIKTGHDWLRQVHILGKSQWWVIPPTCKETSTESEDNDNKNLLKAYTYAKGFKHLAFTLTVDPFTVHDQC